MSRQFDNLEKDYTSWTFLKVLSQHDIITYLFFTVQVPIFAGDNGARADIFDVHVHLWKKENTLIYSGSNISVTFSVAGSPQH